MNKLKYSIVSRDNPVNPIFCSRDFDFHTDGLAQNSSLQAKKGEFFTFQIVVKAQANISELKICSNADFPQVLIGFTSFSNEGVNDKGEYYQKSIFVKKDECRIFWCGFLVSDSAPSGTYALPISICDSQGSIEKFSLNLEILNETALNHGHDDIFNHSRLSWLNSDIGIDDRVTKPFTPIKVEGRCIHILGRSITVSLSGIPEQMESYFENDNSILNPENPKMLFSNPPEFYLGCDGEKNQTPISRELVFKEKTQSRVSWVGKTEFERYTLVADGCLEYDGFLSCRLSVIPKEDFSASAFLNFSYAPKMAEYMIGLGYEGGFCPNSFDWKWDDSRQQDCVYIGSVNAGMQIQLKDRNYRKPHVNIYYHNNPIVVPDCWDNSQKGGISIEKLQDKTKMSIYTGEKQFYRNHPIEYTFECFFTPLKTIDWKERWTNRYLHDNSILDSLDKVTAAEAAFANVINIHHATDVIPFINYPFFETERLKTIVNAAHKKGFKLKPYYTCRELTNHIPEIFPFLTLDDEIYPYFTGKTEGIPGQNGNDAWITENLTDERVITAWKAEVGAGEYKGQICASIIVNSQSRLVNFYLEGLSWMLENLDIDGIYVDDTGLDRTAYRRIRRIMDNHKDGCLIDFHSWNHFEDDMGAGFAGNMNIYMQLLPYINSTWIGEGFDYYKKPDYWLTSICSLMYGVPGEMIDEKGVNNYKGLIYGMTNRPYSGNVKSPTNMWRFLLDWQIEDATLLGYWDKDAPFSSGYSDVPVSTYRNSNRLLIVATNFSEETRSFQLESKLCGISYSIPYIEDYQDAASFDGRLTLETAQGIIILAEVE